MSTNISKEKRERLVQKINAIKTYISSAVQDENTAQLLAYIADIEKDIKGKKYGLVFEEHREGIDEVLANNLPVLTEDTDLFIDNGGQMNFLIEGDNLASLKLLEKTHKGKIDLIYIDPPYNTGNKDFVYDDMFVDGNDTFKHSKWLSFMEKRLQIARNLLPDKGIIFISIDDNEQSQVKLLCDSIFGENNFICNFIRTNKSGSGHDSREISIEYDYMLAYAKNKMQLHVAKQLVDTENDKKYKYIDEFVDTRGKYYLRDLDYKGSYSPSLDYPIEINNIDVYAGGKYGRPNTWRWSKPKVEWGLENGFIVIDEKKSKVYIKQYQYVDNNNQARERTIPFNAQITFLNAVGSKELKDILTQDIFSFPKPTTLIEFVLKLSGNNSATILDFFAGSGTTGHAVMKLNAEDGGSRKFILCTNNENNICRDVTYERIKRVIAKEDYKASLKYFKVEYLPISDKLYYEYADELLLHIRELVELENGINFNGNAEIAIVLTEKELDDFTQNIPETCKAIYVGHDVLPTEEQEKIFAKNKIKVNVIPEYYYRDLEG